MTRRIAAYHNLSGVHEQTWPDGKHPGIWANHRAAMLLPLRGLRQDVVLWTTIRLPAPRCLSQFYWLLLRDVRVCPPAAALTATEPAPGSRLCSMLHASPSSPAARAASAS